MSAERRLRQVEPAAEERLAKLLVVDPASGEQIGTYGALTQEQTDQIDGLETEVRAWRMRYANLKRDKEREAREHMLFPAAKDIFDHWRRQCRHPRAAFGADRFEILRPHLERHGVDLCKRAIDGAAFDPFITHRKNGTEKRHDGLDLIFRTADKMEEFCNRAPINEVFPAKKEEGDGDRAEPPPAAHGSPRPGEQDSLWPGGPETRDGTG